MKHIIPIVVLGAFVAACGCNKGNSGGPGAVSPASDQTTMEQAASTFRQPEDTFSLDTPMMSTKMAQGESKALSIGITRGKNIDQDVTLNFKELPKGVTIDPMNPLIKHGDMETEVTVTATADAALGDFTVKVSGHPTTGADATTDLKISVDEA